MTCKESKHLKQIDGHLKKVPMIRLLFFLLTAAVSGCLAACGAIDHKAGVALSGPWPRAYRDSGGWVVDGLHVTGSPIAVDIASYRLSVSGNVQHPLSLSYDEIREMPSVREQTTLVCPGVFVDKGVWTGVPLRDILSKAGLKDGSIRVVFITMDERYRSELPLAKALSDGVLIAYEFDGKTFDRRNGFPLRLVVRNEPGYYWVKWLGRIEVIAELTTSETK
jgi:DMSO/TMAO reductase YedYZ molybdopterin-dependent catalytic subunit